MSSENKEKPQGVRNLPNTSTNGNRGYKRPRNSRGHFASCKNGSASALAINCECITFSQEQKNISGYLDSEPDDIDVPLSKRINRLNIENPALSTSKEHPVLPALHAVNNGGTSVAHLHPESSNTSMNENRNLISYSQLQTFSNPPSFSGSVQGELQSNNLPINQNASLPGYSVMPGSMHHIDDIRDLAYSNIHSSPSGTFKERYNYPENSQYFKSNQLLNSLFLERQVRHNS